MAGAHNGVIVLDDTANLSTSGSAPFLPFFFPHPVLPSPPPPEPRFVVFARFLAARLLARSLLTHICVCVCVDAIMVVSVREGGRQTFKSTPPQSNYRPGHETRCPCIIYGSCRVPHTEAISCTLGHGGRKGREGKMYDGEEPAGDSCKSDYIGVDNSTALWKC